MEIGVVVHGPGIVDSGWALEIINLLSKLGNVRCRLGGTMGRTAIIDAGLEDKVDISLKLLPSESLNIFNSENVDVIFLLDYGKSSETGHTFGFKVLNHYFKKISDDTYLATNHRPLFDSRIPVFQIERPGEEDGSIISWNVALNRKIAAFREEGSSEFEDTYPDVIPPDILLKELSRILNLKIVDAEDIADTYFSEFAQKEEDALVENFFSKIEDKDAYKYRKIHGVSIGDNIFINGHVVGKANSNNLVLIAKDKFLVEILGGTIKEHGVEKLGKIDLDNVIVKTGLLRVSDKVKPRILEESSQFLKDECDYVDEDSSDDYNYLKVGFVNHVAYDVYRFKNCDLVVTIGDDTTLVSSDILYRLNIPIIGITDGDLDKVIEKSFVNENSVICEVAPGLDDIVGEEIYKNIFNENVTLEIPYYSENKSRDEVIELFKTSIFNEIERVDSGFMIK
ncbi:MAG: DUF2117 domain-containing protein [Methanobacteriaceae archaeon]|nr:DUF2117 domain-containing protein [Methanobacteriaceae archaeon]